MRAVAACARPPGVFISGSAIGYYGPHGDEPVTESTPPARTFSRGSASNGKQEARKVESPRRGWSIVRTGLPLDRDGGALGKMLLPFKLCLGATLGSGDQFMPWIHVDDWTAMVSWLIQNDRAAGAFNATAPAPVTNRTFTRTLGRVLHRPAVLHAPAFVLHAALGRNGVGAARRPARLARRGGAAWISFYTPRARAGAREPQPLIAQD